MLRDVYHFLNPTHLKELLVGTKAWEDYWSNHHSDLSPYHPHRKYLIDTILKYNPKSVLEIGCDTGQNLQLIAYDHPEIKCVGIDINAKSIADGNLLYKMAGYKNIELLQGKAGDLSRFNDNSFDVVFTDAVLMYIGKDKITSIILDMLAKTKLVLIMCEWIRYTPPYYPHKFKAFADYGNYYRGGWRYDYTRLALPVNKYHVRVKKITHEMWPDKIWSKYGAIIEVQV